MIAESTASLLTSMLYSAGHSSGVSTAAIAGGVVGSILGLAIIGLLAFLLYRRRARAVVAAKSERDPSPFRLPAPPPRPGQSSAVPGGMATGSAAGAPAHAAQIVRSPSSVDQSLAEHVDLPPPAYRQIFGSPASTHEQGSSTRPTSSSGVGHYEGGGGDGGATYATVPLTLPPSHDASVHADRRWAEPRKVG